MVVLEYPGEISGLVVTKDATLLLCEEIPVKGLEGIFATHKSHTIDLKAGEKIPDFPDNWTIEEIRFQEEENPEGENPEEELEDEDELTF